ncbi:DoxX family membrane protein [Leptospira idonii]|uniref:DoxX family membrane protein n=1 Tax=Leptospira idonii TaxID=1193500 RepID=A0A4R9M6T9_9LEPT|nr:DoxX family membrane protein [Leptospira idonii]TGN20378.1 DoxX family membrane protein [Leptospira idonii]
MNKAALVIRILLGLIFFVFGLNGFFNFIKGEASGAALAFATQLVESKLFYVVKILEVVAGAALLSNYFVRLAIAILAPITFNIFWFHLVLAQEGLPIGIFVLAANIFLIYYHKDAFAPLFVVKPRN